MSGSPKFRYRERKTVKPRIRSGANMARNTLLEAAGKLRGPPPSPVNELPPLISIISNNSYYEPFTNNESDGNNGSLSSNSNSNSNSNKSIASSNYRNLNFSRTSSKSAQIKSLIKRLQENKKKKATTRKARVAIALRGKKSSNSP